MAEFKSTISSQNFDKALQGGLDYAADKSRIWEALENAGGLSDTEKALMLTLFKNAAYTADVSATITQLEALWTGSEEPDEPIEPDEPVVNTYTVTNTLTNVTNSNAATSVTEGASYTSTLTADEGYEIDSVIVTVGGVDVTASVYANGVVSIPNVSGNIVITATAVEQESGDTRTLLYSWDLTNSLTDTVNGQVATISSADTTQNENGVTVSGASGYLYLGKIMQLGTTIEIDFSNVSKSYASGHGRLVALGKGDSGLIYRNTGAWNIYSNGSWGTDGEKAVDCFSGKTLKIAIGTDNTVVASVDGVEIASHSNFTIGNAEIQVGTNSGNAFYTFTATACRIYEGV